MSETVLKGGGDITVLEKGHKAEVNNVCHDLRLNACWGGKLVFKRGMLVAAFRNFNDLLLLQVVWNCF